MANGTYWKTHLCPSAESSMAEPTAETGSATLIETRPELRQLALIEPNQQLASDLRERFRNDARATVKRKALDYREDQLELSFPLGANTHGTLNPAPCSSNDHLRQDVPTTSLDQPYSRFLK